MILPKNKTWFVVRYFNWGWYPETWEGWSVCTIYAVVIVGAYLLFAESITFLIVLFFATCALLTICRLKERRPSSRMDKKEKYWKAGKLP